jgi:hypothetical protein
MLTKNIYAVIVMYNLKFCVLKRNFNGKSINSSDESDTSFCRKYINVHIIIHRSVYFRLRKLTDEGDTDDKNRFVSCCLGSSVCASTDDLCRGVLPLQRNHSKAWPFGAQHWTWGGGGCSSIRGEYIKRTVPRPAVTLFGRNTPARNPIDVFSFFLIIEFPFHLICFGLI